MISSGVHRNDQMFYHCEVTACVPSFCLFVPMGEEGTSMRLNGIKNKLQFDCIENLS